MSEVSVARPPSVLEYHGSRPPAAIPVVPLRERILLAEHGVLVSDARVTAGRTTVAISEIAAVKVRLVPAIAIDVVAVVAAVLLAMTGLAVWAASGSRIGLGPALLCWTGSLLLFYFVCHPLRQSKRYAAWVECRSGRRHALGNMDRITAHRVADAIIGALVAATKSGQAA